ncbi:MAG: DUF692 domain-containing protein [Gammaproteobacteria bacterium]|nr:DUF692 domain-containing protein [Gammaproteobacteria bacterium]
MSERYPVKGAGLGLRRALLKSLKDQAPEQIGFMEAVPENWIGVGGRLGKRFRAFTERYPFVAHGLSLSIGGVEPIDVEFVKQVRSFLDQHNIRAYTDHLTYCSDGGHLYDLMPIPFTSDAVRHVADRIRQVEDILERPFAIENASYYAAPGMEMTEIEFVNAVLEEADCGLLLDVNNIYVNSINHRYDAEEFLTALPAERVVYFHVAGHYVEAEDLRVDTHAAPVIDPVWQLLDKAYEHCGVVPTLLERDFNIPPLADLLSEMDVIIELQKKWSQPAAQVSHG